MTPPLENGMSKGNPRIVFRISKTELSEIEAAIASANCFRMQEEYSVSEWIRQAIREKLCHLRRARQRPKATGKQTTNN